MVHVPPLVLEALCDSAKTIYRGPATVWKKYTPTDDDMREFKKEATAKSEFDPLELKSSVWNKYVDKRYSLHAHSCSNAIVIAILPPGVKVPLDDWGRIFQWLGNSDTGKPWKVFWLGNETRRLFPQVGAEITSEHLNGGYTYPCSTHGIFVYRMEEATRVLIHELLHAACLDPVNASLPVKEATIETWAELFLIAHRAGGNIEKAEKLLKIQLKWVSETNAKAQNDNNVKNEQQYAWRYLNGREHVYNSLGIVLPKASATYSNVKQTRFTHPKLGD